VKITVQLSPPFVVFNILAVSGLTFFEATANPVKLSKKVISFICWLPIFGKNCWYQLPAGFKGIINAKVNRQKAKKAKVILRSLFN
jgi:hypothetical protein